MKHLNSVFVVIGACLVIYAYSVTFWSPVPGLDEPLEIAPLAPGPRSSQGTSPAAASGLRPEPSQQGVSAAASSGTAVRTGQTPAVSSGQDQDPSSGVTSAPSRPAGVVTGGGQPPVQRQPTRPAGVRPGAGFVSTPRSEPPAQQAPQRTGPARTAPQRTAPAAPPVRGSMSNR